MFDTYRITPAAPSVHVHNETKPQDAADAARLYGELKAQAEREVAGATVTRFGAENEITAVVVHQDHDLCNDKHRIRLLFKLNGVLHDLNLTTDAEDVLTGFYREIAEKLVGDALTRISNRLR